jgi:hypothetical protein
MEEQTPTPTSEELAARLAAFEKRTLDLENVLVALVLKFRFDARAQDAFTRIRQGLDGL